MNRIDGINPLITSRTSQGQPAAPAEGAAQRRLDGTERAAGRLDHVSLSSRGREVAEAARAVGEARDVRLEKVMALKAAIADGTYRSNAREIAERLVSTGTFNLE